MHTPALLKEAVESLFVTSGDKFIDATFGEGGYSQEILRRGGKVLAIDLDRDQIQNLKSKIPNLKLIQGNFANVEEIAKENDFFPVAGVIFDLGLSMGQIENSGRGFSYKKTDEPLDMRIDAVNQTTAAADLIRQKSPTELYEVLAKNSEEIKSKIIAEEIKRGRKMESVGDLIGAIDRAVGFKSQSVYARIFQALRMEINHELDNLKRALAGASRILKKNGRIVVVSFHSLEDRIVKNFGKQYRFLKKKPYSKKLGLSFERSAKIRTIII